LARQRTAQCLANAAGIIVHDAHGVTIGGTAVVPET